MKIIVCQYVQIITLEYMKIKNALWMSLEKISVLISGLIIAIYLAKEIEKEAYGIYIYITLLGSFLSILVSFGIDSIAIRYLVKYKKKINTLISNIILIRLVLFSISYALIIIISYIFEKNEIAFLISIYALTLIQYVFNSFWLVNQSKVQNISIAKLIFFTTTLSFIIKILTINYIEQVLYTLIIIDVFIAFSVSILSYLICKKSYNISLKLNKFRFKLILKILKEALPLFISAAAILFYTKIDQFMLKQMLGFDSLAEYSLAVKFSQFWYFFPLIITSIFYPSLISSKNTSKSNYEGILSGLICFFFFLSIAVSLCFYYIFPLFTNSFFSDNYNDLSKFTFLLSLSGLFVCMGYVNGKWIVCEKLYSITLYRNLMGLMINLFLNYVFIPVFGIYGAIYSTLISISFTSYFSFLFFDKTRNMFFLQTKSLLHINNMKYLIRNY